MLTALKQRYWTWTLMYRILEQYLLGCVSHLSSQNMRFKSNQGFQTILEGAPTRWSISVFFDGMGMRWPWCVTVWQWWWQFLAVGITTPQNSNKCKFSLYLHHGGKQSSFKRENTSGVWVYRPGHTYSYWKFSAVFDRTGSFFKETLCFNFFIVIIACFQKRLRPRPGDLTFANISRWAFLETFKNWNTSPSNLFQCMILWFCLPGKSLAFARLKFGRSFAC